MIFAPYDIAIAERERAGKPIRIAVIGAGNLVRMILPQLVNPRPDGFQLVAIVNRTASRALELLGQNGIVGRTVEDATQAEDAIRSGAVAVTSNVEAIVGSDHVDVVLEATGTTDYALEAVLGAITHRKHVIVGNAELDSTIGPYLNQLAKSAGVVYSNIDGDEPGVAMDLVRYARSLGLRVVAAGNLKGMIDLYRNPDTQAAFAQQHGQNPRIVASFADGTKLAMEATILANATGFRVGQPGMYGPPCAHVRDIAGLLPADEMLEHGLIDYALGAEPHTGAFIVVSEPREHRQRALQYLKMGKGPFYVFYTPYHLPHLQVLATIARAALTHDATVAPAAGPVCTVVARAKTDLAAGTTLDGVGGFSCYGQIQNCTQGAIPELGLPITLSENCRLLRAVQKDEVVRVADVAIPEGAKAFNLWQAMMSGNTQAN